MIKIPIEIETAARLQCEKDHIHPEAGSYGKDRKTRRAWENRALEAMGYFNEIKRK